MNLDFSGPLGDLFRYRVLLRTLVVRELKARYRGSTLGFLWSFLNPLLLMAVYSLVFSVYFRAAAGEVKSYSPFLFSGLLPWLWFASSLLEGSQAVIAQGGLVNKAMFPAEILPITYVLSNLVHFVLSLPILLLFLIFFRVPLTTAWAYLPVLLLLQLILTLGLTLLLAAASVFFRDLQHILANGLTLLFFLTPIIYPRSAVPAQFVPLLHFNPMAPLIMAYQNIFYFGQPPVLSSMLKLLGVGVVMLVVGYWYFSRNRDEFAELV